MQSAFPKFPRALLPRLVGALFAFTSVRVIAAAAFVAAATVLFLFQAVFAVESSALIFLGVDLSAAQQEVLAPLLTRGLVYPVLALLAFFAASAAVRALSREHVFAGVLIGLFGALGAQVLLLRFPDSNVLEATAYAVFGTAGGALGGARGLDVRTRGVSREEMNSRVLDARTPRDVAEGVFRHLAPVGALAVFVWQADAGRTADAGYPRRREIDEAAKPWASWACHEWQGEPPPDAGPIRRVPAAGPGAETMVLSSRGEGGTPAKRGWSPHPRAGSTVFLALVDPAGEPFGVLAAAFPGVRAPRAARREFAAAAQQASVVLHGMLLAVENREMGERLQRERFRGQLHDSALDHMNLAKMDLKRLVDAPAAGAGDEPAEAPDGLVRILENVSEAIREIRRLVRGGRPESLESGVPLAAALAHLAENASERSTVLATAETTGDPCPLPPGVGEELYWAAREALNNVVKHSRAGRAKVTLSYLDAAVALDVMDDGVGPNATGGDEPGVRREGGDGLPLLVQRVERLKGTLQIEERPGGGTIFTVRFALAPTQS